MAWKPGPNAPLGLAAVNPVIPDVAGSPTYTTVGQVAQFIEDTLGWADLIYLPGVAALVAGDIVAYDLLPGGAIVTRGSLAMGANSGRPLAVALTPIVVGQYGWYQLTGIAIVNSIAGGVAGPAMLSATVGSIGSAAQPGGQISGMRISSAVGMPAAGKVYATLNRPTAQTQIT